MNKKLIELLMSGKPLRGAMIDTYNQQVQYDVACTIRTNINTANHHFIVEEVYVEREAKRDSEKITSYL